MFNSPRKLFRRLASLQVMKIRLPSDKRASWRGRFLEIARQVEGGAPHVLARVAGLRPRPRMAGFVGLRRNRTGLPGMA
jgi:hypothetical protein